MNIATFGGELVAKPGAGPTRERSRESTMIHNNQLHAEVFGVKPHSAIVISELLVIGTEFAGKNGSASVSE